ncbi:MAG: PQQ-binding-like beta-propeller repeat protein, partial [Candidatus Hydrogenedentota bacterium]
QWDSIDGTILADNKIRATLGALKATPLMVDGVLYLSTSLSQVVALDAGTGKQLWSYDSGSWKDGRPANLGFIHRGVSYWNDRDEQRIIIATGNSKLIALNPKTGKLLPDFGDNGKVDLLLGLNKPARVGIHQVNSPPVICNDVIVVGSVIMDRPTLQSYVRGDVRGYDVRTGKKLWQFHSIPQEGEFGNDTWESDAWKIAGSTNVWSMISADEELDYVYLPFGAATNDFYGGHRPGDNLFATSLVCLNAKTGERVWHFQTVHHDLWDYDLPCAPNLVDITVDGKDIKAVAQVSKTGYTYVFDRVTGEPVWPIPEVAVPQSTLPGEQSSPTQPIPTKPPPFATQGITEDTIIDFTPELKEEALKILEDYDHGPIFTPATERGLAMTPGDGGGANWMGASWDPESSLLYVPSISYVTLIKLIKPDPNRSDMRYVVEGYTGQLPGPQGLPLIKPPYGKVTAIDLSNGTHAWNTPIGKGLEANPKVKELGLNIAPTGGGGWMFPLATKTMLLGAHTSNLLALDKKTGEQTGELPIVGMEGSMLGHVTGAPITYMHKGKQYIVASVTGRQSKGYVIALTLP